MAASWIKKEKPYGWYIGEVTTGAVCTTDVLIESIIWTPAGTDSTIQLSDMTTGHTSGNHVFYDGRASESGMKGVPVTEVIYLGSGFRVKGLMVGACGAVSTGTLVISRL